tara:strand:+ start:1093 stop:1470 length:378 start_codon:yes stop_codon:yes gene_type:complete
VTKQQKEHLLILSYLFLRHAKYEKALVLLLILKRIFPEDAHILLSRAYAYISMNVYKGALEEADEALNLTKNPAYVAYAHLVKARAFWHMEKPNEAREEFRHFLRYKQHIQRLKEAASEGATDRT